ncbi:MAG: DMT family transporter [Bacteroidota bacterium]
MSGKTVLRSRTAVYALTALTMVAFAANSVLCRLALQTTGIGAATFTAVRVASGALVLWGIVRWRSPGASGGGWTSAVALFVYAAAFSFAYLALATGTGALLLFGAVQLTMIGWGLVRGERLSARQTLGMAAALGGLVYLVLPGLEAPPLGAALVMATSGVGWGIYSLRGRGSAQPAVDTAGNFARASVLAVGLGAAWWLAGEAGSANAHGLGYALASGAVTSGLGYVVWYAVLPSLRATSAATVQLSVPILAALGGVVFVGEAVTLRLALASLLTLGGIALVLRAR